MPEKIVDHIYKQRNKFGYDKKNIMISLFSVNMRKCIHSSRQNDKHNKKVQIPTAVTGI